MNEEKTYKDGLAEGRKEGAQQQEIRTTLFHIQMLTITQRFSVEEAMNALCIPKKERNTYRKTFAKRIPKAKTQAKNL